MAWGVWRSRLTSACRSAISERTSVAGAVVDGSQENDASMALMMSKAAGVVAAVEADVVEVVGTEALVASHMPLLTL